MKKVKRCEVDLVTRTREISQGFTAHPGFRFDIDIGRAALGPIVDITIGLLHVKHAL